MKKLRVLRRRLLLQYLLTVGALFGGSEIMLYHLSRWAGDRELDTALRMEVEKLAAAIEFDRGDGSVEIEGEHHWDAMRFSGRTSYWQVLLGNGSTVSRSRKAFNEGENLPILGGDDLALDELSIADAAYGRRGTLRAARLQIVRKRPPQSKHAAHADRDVLLDIRAAVDRRGLDEHLRRLAWCLIGGFPVVFGLAAIGGYWLIQRAVRPVEEAFQRERRFTGAASHELRTPLTALRGEIDVTLRRPRSAAEYQETIRRMDALVGRMTGLVEGLLVLARAEGDHLLSDESELSVESLERAIKEAIRQLPNHERVAVRCAAAKTMAIVGDSLLLAISVRNLVENSLLHSPDGPIDLRIAESADGGGLEIIVEDQGAGIPPEVLAAMEKEGRAGAGPRRSNGGGAGLGLSITRAVVKSHGGKLHLENLPENGFRATIWLPVAPPP